MNLNKKAKRDAKKMEDGVWVNWAEDVRFKIRSDNTDGYRAAYSEALERYRTELNAGGAARIRAMHNVSVEVAGRYSIADWEKVELEDNVPLPCTEENRLKICTDFIDVLMFVQAVAREFQPYKLQEDPDTQKKSEKPSSGGEPSGTT